MSRESDPWADLDDRLRAVEAHLGIRADEPVTDRPSRNVPARRATPPKPSSATPKDGVFWVVDGLREQLADVAGGGVVLAGIVETAGGSGVWQYGQTTEALLAVDEGAADGIASRLSALGHPVRLRLLLAVLRGETSTASLGKLDGMGTTGQVYHHIRILTAAGWLRSVGRGSVRVPPERVVPLLVTLTAALE
ncbi:ArsR family transcriptional regulator [Plantactinospora sp. GCM10030261]|uniref:ArsR family transcriptional regulator n=1 Tax=Plantactinospora sp. GCM10030261 TaxID=3273420 RepID=UPI00361ECA11